MKNKPTMIFIVLILCLSLTACNFPGTGNSTDNIAMQQTGVAQTVEVLKTQLSVQSTPEVPVIVTNTPETFPTIAFTPTLETPLTPPTPTSTSAPVYRIGKVVDVTYPDDTVVKPSESFTKTWRLTNSGTGTWTSNFKLVFVSGESMGGPASTTLNQSVAPGQTIDITVQLKAPATSGTYQGKWMLQTESGTSFGLGTNADGPFWVKVVVGQSFAITNAVVSASPATWSGACPVDLVFTANITATASGTATYYFVTSLGNSSTYNLAFSAAGTVTTGTYTVSVPSSQTVTASIYNDYPNHQSFGTTSVDVACTTP